MTFIQEIQKISPHIDSILDMSKIITPNFIKKVELLGSIDDKKLEEAVRASKNIKNVSDELIRVNSMHKNIVSLDNIRDSIEKVSEHTELFKRILSNELIYINVDEIELDIQKVLLMKRDIEAVLEIDIDINYLSQITQKIKKIEQEKQEIKKIRDEIHAYRDEIVAYTKTNKMIADSIHDMIDENKKINNHTQYLLNRQSDMTIQIHHVQHDEGGLSYYDKSKNKLILKIPQGKQGNTGKRGKQGLQGIPGSAVYKGDKGDKGDDGKDGKSFTPMFSGNKIDINRYNSQPIGTSFLALDEIPAMIYFRNSNTSGKWTDGQPFGSTEGLTAGKAEDSEKLSGYTVNDLLEHIRNMMQNQ